jgi:hypothetical protein
VRRLRRQPAHHPRGRHEGLRTPPQTLARPKGGIEGDWLGAIVEGRKAVADFAYSARLTELTLLGNIAKRVDSRILWDDAAMRVTTTTPPTATSKPPAATAGSCDVKQGRDKARPD